MKRCPKCDRSLPQEGFYRLAAMKDGLMGICKDCHKAAVTLRRRTNPAVQAYDRERAMRPERVALRRSITKRWREQNPVAYAAQTAVGNALRTGKLKREPCLFCKADENIHAHHRDYNKPLDVVWLCANCHHRLHATFPETAGHEQPVSPAAKGASGANNLAGVG